MIKFAPLLLTRASYDCWASLALHETKTINQFFSGFKQRTKWSKWDPIEGFNNKASESGHYVPF